MNQSCYVYQAWFLPVFSRSNRPQQFLCYCSNALKVLGYGVQVPACMSQPSRLLARAFIKKLKRQCQPTTVAYGSFTHPSHATCLTNMHNDRCDMHGRSTVPWHARHTVPDLKCISLNINTLYSVSVDTMGFWLGTLVFFLIQLVVTACINFFGKSSNKGLTHIMAFTAVFQCWLMWGIVYLAQVNPLVNPEYKE